MTKKQGAWGLEELHLRTRLATNFAHPPAMTRCTATGLLCRAWGRSNLLAEE